MNSRDDDLIRRALLNGFQQTPHLWPVRPRKPGLVDRLALRTGELFVSFGLKLKARYWMAVEPRQFFDLDLGSDFDLR
jgi:hypothetical protein